MIEKLKNTDLSQTDQDKLRRNFRRMFWDIDTTKLDFEKHHKTIITQVLNYGYPEEIQALFGIYSEETIREALKNPIKGMWFPSIYRAFCNMLDVPPRQQAVNRLFIERKQKKANKLFTV